MARKTQYSHLRLPPQLLKMLQRFFRARPVLLILLTSTLAACAAGNAVKPAEEAGEPTTGQAAATQQGTQAVVDGSEDPIAIAQRQVAVDQLNKKLAVEATKQSSTKAKQAVEEYRLGVGDVINVTVFQVAEMSRRYRVNANGTVIFPLIGAQLVGGSTVAEVEQSLTEVLGEKYLQDPQVTVFVDEYRSQQITVMGAVQTPAVHSIQQPRSLLDVLSLSGGLSTDAGKHVYVRTIEFDAATGGQVEQNLVIDVESLVDSNNTNNNLILRGGDSVLVPQAGVVFVEGEVNAPGAYPMRTRTNVLKAIALAGGVSTLANQGAVQILRQEELETEVLEVSLQDIRNNKSKDVELKDGDIVVVRANVLKKGWTGFWRGLTGIVGFSKPL